MGSAERPNRLVQDGDGSRQSAIVQAYFEHKSELRRFIVARYGEDHADDLMQDLYVKVFGLETIGVIRNLTAYLYRLALNLTHDAYRQRSRAQARDGAWRMVHHTKMGGEDVADLPPMEEALMARHRLALLLEAVKALPPKTQEVFRLHKFEGLTQAQTAHTLGMSQRMVEKRMRAALNLLLAKVGAQ
jgi:RNA polymerase sigma factor (sigma-70 family)